MKKISLCSLVDFILIQTLITRTKSSIEEVIEIDDSSSSETTPTKIEGKHQDRYVHL